MTDRIYLTDRISYIKASDEPLSADVGIIEGDEAVYLFDIGNQEEVAEYLEALPKKKKIILSHFHPDHMGNLGRISFDTVYASANTEKYFKNHMPGCVPECIRVPEPVVIEDGIRLEIHPVLNSHAKGSLLLMADEAYIFIGDALYCKVQDGAYVFNAQLLKEEIELLKRLPAKKIFVSHKKNPIKGKAGVVRYLEQIYAKRQKDDAYIRV